MFKRVKEAVSFISLTVHWLDDHFERRSAALNVDVFPGSHTGDAIADKLTYLLASWGLDKIRVHLLMRNNGGNMAEGCRVSDIGSEGCTIHALQLVIKNTIEGNEAVSILLKKCKKISKFFHKSAPARWNSTLYLMLRFLELEFFLDLFSEAEGDDSKSLTCAEWEILEELANLLQPFKEVTKSLIYNESCISEVIPTIKTLHFCSSKQKFTYKILHKSVLEAEIDLYLKQELLKHIITSIKIVGENERNIPKFKQTCAPFPLHALEQHIQRKALFRIRKHFGQETEKSTAYECGITNIPAPQFATDKL
ncbi:zinc finger BED domain-containing protein 4-like [Belonocnema kinseyi]|uniref:zinc finger BED domain-containing protein 4-like n=1 Tax=Belonocnema kinseyi TaxID=2817044 RepID=UPI00143DD63A|nr:zinc finger BED domain-containing protein 4-like [Belonocnema kinseyi]